VEPLPAQRAKLVDYVKSLDCIHCGLCLQTCPTFRLTGQEASSPRGRIHLMRAVAEERLAPDAVFADEMEFCLLCRHCESVCPAGVQFGSMMEFTRGALEREQPGGLVRRTLRWLGFRLVLPHRSVLRLAGSLLRAAQLLRLDRLADRVLPGRGFGALPRVPALSARRLLPRRQDAAGAARGELVLLEGCVMPEFHAHVNRATARSLARLGFAVRVPEVACCGSLHAHNGDLDGARALARVLIAAFERERDERAAPLDLVVNSAGCGAHLKELHHLFPADEPWHARAAALAARVRDYSEVVAARLSAAGTNLGTPPVAQPITWDDPCHLCHAQNVRSQPRAVLAALPGLARVELADSESCCGSAGIYSLLRPAASRAVFAKKLADLERSGARTLVTANPGCQMQWESGLARAGSDVRVLHLAELVDAALEAAVPPKATGLVLGTSLPPGANLRSVL
jgi:glycolate oxidase iron-sulfur subunit